MPQGHNGGPAELMADSFKISGEEIRRILRESEAGKPERIYWWEAGGDIAADAAHRAFRAEEDKRRWERVYQRPFTVDPPYGFGASARDGRYSASMGGRQSGKTYAAAREAMEEEIRGGWSPWRNDWHRDPAPADQKFVVAADGTIVLHRSAWRVIANVPR